MIHRHLKELEAVEPHRHMYRQILVYLGGSGVQLIENQSHSIRAGTVIFLQSSQDHAFQKTKSVRPLCLVLDLELEEEGVEERTVSQLTQSELNRIRQALHRLMEMENPQSKSCQIRTGGTVLLILDILLRNLKWLPEESSSKPPPILKKVRSVLLQPGNEELSLRKVAQKVGYQQDYLNRLLKRSTGMTLNQIRSRERVEKAKRLLEQSLQVQVVAEQVGILDQNYFARWFRQQTGKTPTQWRK